MADEVHVPVETADDFLDNAMNPGEVQEVQESQENQDPTPPQDQEPAQDPNQEPTVDIDPEELEEVSNTLRETIRSFSSENADKETLALKQDLLEEFKGNSFDDEGNILDKDGKVLVKFEDVAKEIASQDKALYDDEGNQVDKEGKIIATKEEIEIANNEINQMAKEAGYNFLDENGNTKIYPKGTEGIKMLSEDIANAKSEEFKKEFFNSNPVLTEVAKHLLAGKDIEDFQKPIDYSKVDIKELSNDQKKAYIKQSLMAEGVADERASKIAETFGEKELDKEAEESLNVLQQKEEAKQLARQQEFEREIQEQQQETEKYWGKVEQTISKGDLEGFNLPESDKKDFFRYLAIPVKDNKSQDQLDRESYSLSKHLKEAYYRFKGYNLEDIVKDRSSKSRVNNLRSRIQKREELSGSNKSNIKGNAKEDNLLGLGELT